MSGGGSEILYVRAEKLCQWCGWRFEISMAPYSAAQFRSWVDLVNMHRVDCKAAFLLSKAAMMGLNEAGMHFLGSTK